VEVVTLQDLHSYEWVDSLWGFVSFPMRWLIQEIPIADIVWLILFSTNIGECEESYLKIEFI